MTTWPGQRISLIVPCLDEGADIGATLASLQHLRSAGHELILADGGSRDGTVDAADGLVDAVVVTRPGRARQMNAGAALAKGGVLWFLHADTRVGVVAVGEMLEALRGRDQGWGRFDVRLSGKAWPLRLIERTMNLRSRLSGIATGDQGIFVTRRLFDEVGGFPDIPLMEDIELARRLKRRKRPLCLKGPLVTSSRRWEREGIWRTVLLMWRLRLAYRLGVPAERLALRYRACGSPTPGS